MALLEKKGFPDHKIIECHGSVHYMQCEDCGVIFPTTDIVVPPHNEEFRAIGDLPYHSCGRLIRPNVLMFDDGGWDGSREVEQTLNYKNFLRKIKDSKAVIIEIGAGTYVPTVRYEGEDLVEMNSNRTLVRINPNEYHKIQGLEDQMISIPLGGLKALRRIDECIENLKKRRLV